MNDSLTDYVRIGQTENLYSNGIHFGVKIEVALGRPITEKDRAAIRHYLSKIENDLMTVSMSLDPEVMERRKKQREEILNLFPGFIVVDEIPNQYGPEGYWLYSQTPWFLVTTRFGKIKIGWRKRVISISWDDTFIPNTADDLFPDDHSTKEGPMIHAWSLETARLIIKALFVAGDKEIARRKKNDWA